MHHDCVRPPHLYINMKGKIFAFIGILINVPIALFILTCMFGLILGLVTCALFFKTLQTLGFTYDTDNENEDLRVDRYSSKLGSRKGDW